ncbi:hypothetical protein HHK36_010250 [Tetracentron sinense]|uniref:TLDc domain-containing protein n=1 Tax=Tetracentron sinense TaxID=13715 RepID=A0A835DJ24_TETSI|nr:hypothetical protein HHK36_010250 [Tetracentron sinense]
MGASSSTDQVSREQQEVESLAASTGALPMLQKAFFKLSDPQTKAVPLKSLKECFCLTFANPISEASPVPECFPGLLSHLGSSIVDLFFRAGEGGVNWIEFLRGYIRCCGRMSVSISLNTLYRLYAATGVPTKVEFESDDADSKISGSFTPTDVLMLLWMCWTMLSDSRNLKSSEGKAKLDLPDINHLVLSAVISCTEIGDTLNVWDFSISGLEVQLPAGKLHMWALTTAPSLTNCFTQFVHVRLQKCGTSEEDELQPSSSSAGDISSTEAHDTHILTRGRAWAISLTLRNSLSEELLKVCFPKDGDGAYENLLYRTSLHGKGLNRFWSNIEGYHGPLLMLISASSRNDHEGGGTNVGRWVIGVLTLQGFENRDMFYGSSGYLYSLSPIFHVFSHSGKEKNFVYSHLHPTSRVYEPQPKPVGIGFGGTVGNERISVDEDFAKVTVRHHAVDKTYQPGSLIPNQGFLPSEALVLEVEVWGLGGEKPKEEQSAYKNREQLFTQQRRKVDLKTFANWDDSPEKVMMDMVSAPNRVQREAR